MLDPDTEAGSYIEDDPKAWEAFVAAMHTYGSQFASVSSHLGSDHGAAEVLSGAMLSWMADQHGVFVHSAATTSSATPSPEKE